MQSHELAAQVAQHGFAIQEAVLPPEARDALCEELAHLSGAASIRQRGGIFAIRNLLDLSASVAALASSDCIAALVRPILGPSCFPVRGILFDKIPSANWKVPWHQDVTIAVQEKIACEGFGPWSRKAEVLGVQPLVAVLQNMLSVRLHLDSCHAENGALHVLPGSHRHGRIAETNMEALRASGAETICTVSSGGALLMRPLLLHASYPSQAPGHRRVIHLDFASAALPCGMRWFAETPSRAF